MNTLKPLKRKNGMECLFCGSRKSTYRIHTDNLGYDEVSCSKHARDLEAHADNTLGEHTVKRWHITSSRGVKRGEIWDWNEKGSVTRHIPANVVITDGGSRTPKGD